MTDPKARALQLADEAWRAAFNAGDSDRLAADVIADYMLTFARELLARKPTEAMKTAGCLAISEIYRREGGWCGMKAAEDQTLATWTDMAAELAKEL